ncbi:MAG: rhomboid family intramembrane serine protease [Bacteroidia bacterium]|nr:rhomboid family intramembrane serine protease [Bacteroidia bacterium]MDW8089399.1 rhomboid family intramembrane serine protease [Bacteroidia bacterium]
MIPLRDINPSRSLPLFTVLLIGTNVGLFWKYSTGDIPFEQVILQLGYLPAEGFSLERAITSMFMHGSWLHLLLNMWFLWVFGDNVEDALGRLGFLVLYGLSGLGALGLHGYLYAHSEVPVVGASGAISGIMGAYLVLFPRAQILAWVPPLYFTTLSSRFFLGLWFVLQVIEGLLDKWSGWRIGEAGGVAFWAHIGGFVVGWIVAQVWSGWRDRAEL